MNDWLDELSADERADWDRFVEHYRRNVVNQIAESSVFLSLVPDEPPDVKFAAELGFAILFNKPIIAVTHSQRDCPAGLRRVAHSVIEADIDLEEGRQKLADVLSRTLEAEA